MISGKFIVKVGLACLFVAFVGMVLIFNDMSWGKYIVYTSVIIGSITVMIGGFAASVGQVKDDLKD